MQKEKLALLLIVSGLLLADAAVSGQFTVTLPPLEVGPTQLTSVEVDSSSAFSKALRDQQVGVITIRKDVKLRPEHFPELIELQRSVEIVGIPGRNVSLDLDSLFLRSRVAVRPARKLTFRQLILDNPRAGPGFFIDLVAASSGAVVEVRDSTWRQEICGNDTRMAGQGSVSLTVNLTNKDFCLGSACWPIDLQINTETLLPPGPENSPRSGGSYFRVLANVTRVCSRYVLPSCAAVKGEEECLVQEYAALKAQTESAMKASSGPSKTVITIAAALGTGILAVGLVLGVLYVWRRHRQRLPWRKEEQLPSVCPPSPPHLESVESHRLAPVKVWPPKYQSHVRAGPDASPLTNSTAESSKIDTQPLADFTPPLSVGQGKGSPLSCQGYTIHLGQVLGSGSFGTVYKGVWKNQIVAVKVIRARHAVMGKIAEEGTLMMSFKHANVVEAYGFEQRIDPQTCLFMGGNEYLVEEGILSPGGVEHFHAAAAIHPMLSKSTEENLSTETWLVEEYCDLGSLAPLVYNKKFMVEGVPQLRPILSRLRDAARGMQYLHSLKVCHGDLKCDNILLSSSSDDLQKCTAKISDFGLSRPLREDASHFSTRTVGTLTHMPPELLSEGILALPGDVYAFGMIMWEMYTGCMPFEGLSYGELLKSVLVDNKRPDFPADTPDAYRDLAQQCLREDPKERPTFTQVLSSIEDMLGVVEDLQESLLGGMLAQAWTVLARKQAPRRQVAPTPPPSLLR